MGNLIVFNVFIPMDDPFITGPHSPAKLDKWIEDTARRFGPVTLASEKVPRFWFHGRKIRGDLCRWYRVVVDADHLDAWQAYLRDTTLRFGLPSLTIERTGEAEVIEAATSLH